MAYTGIVTGSQALLIEDFTRAGTRVEFIKGPCGDSPEDQLLVQFQGMFAEHVDRPGLGAVGLAAPVAFQDLRLLVLGEHALELHQQLVLG